MELEIYCSVYEALKHLPSRGRSLGEVVGSWGMTGKDPYDILAKELSSYGCSSLHGVEIPDEFPSLLINGTQYDIMNLIANPDKLISLCHPASCGDIKTQITTLNKEVKSALESRFELRSGRSRQEPDFIRNIQSKIEHAFDKKIDLIPYKLNVYRKGDFFLPYVDTPTYRNMIGTLIIALPFDLEGGEIIVDGSTYALSSPYLCYLRHNLYWVAFHGDCIHEVKPVISGNRVTLTYSIVLVRSYASPGSESILELINSLLAGDERPLGIFLKHHYTFALSREHLIGEDAKLYDILSKLGERRRSSRVEQGRFKLQLATIALHHHVTYEAGGDNVELIRNVYSMTEADLRLLRFLEDSKQTDSEDIRFIVPKNREGRILRESYDEGAYYTENGSRPGDDNIIYFNAALIIRKLIQE